MAKVLLVDTNFSSGPIYSELVSMGHEVHVVGNNPNDYLAKISPNYWNISYAETDALATLVKDNRFDFIVPGCTDLSYMSCVAINSGRFPGLDTPKACEKIFNKGEFRFLADRLGLPVPRRFTNGEPLDHWPLIVKPVDSFSGKGITVLLKEDAVALKQAIEVARGQSASGEYLTEEFVDGQLHSHTAFIADGQIIQDFIVQEDSTVNPFVVDTSRVLHDFPSSLLAQLRSCVVELVRELDLVDGLMHTQFISDGQKIWLIETTRRCPGDLYSQLIELSTGYPYAKSYVHPYLGTSTPTVNNSLGIEYIMRHTVTVKIAQKLIFLRFKIPLLIERWTPLAVTGDHLNPSPQGRVGILFCRSHSSAELDKVYRITIQRKLYNVDGQ